MYFILKNDILLDMDFTIREPENMPVKLSFLKGRTITISVETPVVFITNASAGDVMLDFKDCSFPLMSKRLLELFEEAGVDNLQVFPAVIKSEVDSTIWDNYFVVNILGVIKCADLSKSTYSELMPGSYMFDELAINADKTKGALLFRLYEDKASIIIHKSVGKYIMLKDPDETIIGWDADDIIQ